MRLLLDTQALILAGQDNLPEKVEGLYRDVENDIFFSLVSLWEIGIKASIGKLKFRRNLADYHDLLVEELGLAPVAIEAQHIEKAVKLPFHHRDPFDRLIIGQAIVEDLTILSGDAEYDAYPCERLWE